MAFIDIETRFTINGDATFSTAVTTALTTIYDNSPLAAAAIDDWLTRNPTKDVTINYVFDTANAQLNDGVVNIDPGYFWNLYYASSLGYAVNGTLLSGLTHELCHAVVGKPDSENWDNLSGENLDIANTWFDELNIPRQASYEAYVTEDLIEPDYDYTRGEEIVNSIIDQGFYTFDGTSITFDTGNVNLIDKGVEGSTLLIGGVRDNTYVGTASRDWIYGGGGLDTLGSGLIARTGL